MKTKIGLTSNVLKLFAVICMIVQHIAILFIPSDGIVKTLMIMAGAFTAPIMCFFVAEGYYRTSNLKKYALRLLIGAVISHVPHALAFGHGVWDVFHATSVMWPLFLGLVSLAVWENNNIHLLLRCAILMVCAVLSYPGNFNCIAILWILSFGVFRGDKVKQSLAFFASCVLHYAQSFVITPGNPAWYRFIPLLVLPMVFLYNGQRGRKSNLIKYGYYIIYPLHLIILYLLNQII